jgi:type IV secretory pathway VirD2 relaxase
VSLIVQALDEKERSSPVVSSEEVEALRSSLAIKDKMLDDQNHTIRGTHTQRQRERHTHKESTHAHTHTDMYVYIYIYIYIYIYK